MGRVYGEAATNKIFVRGDNDERIWDTDYPPVNWMPQSAWISLESFAIQFPDFAKGGVYGYDRDRIIGIDVDACFTACTLTPQYWSSGWASVGTVPAGCNVIDVRGNVVRTKAPSLNLGSNVSNLLNGAPGAQTVFVGGWCPIESEFTWTRVFEFRLNGSTIEFRRSHSTRAANPGETPTYTSNWNNPGWSYWGDPNGVPVGPIDSSSGELGGGGSRRRGGDLACSTSTSGYDFSSAYLANIVIRPGYIKP